MKLEKIKPLFCLRSKECKSLQYDPNFDSEKTCHKCDWNILEMSKEESNEIMRILSEVGLHEDE